MHTTATDGRNSIEEMAAFSPRGEDKHIAITDHSKAVRVAGGRNDKDLAAHTKKIRQANRKIAGIEILAGVEVDILADGGLDLAEETLAGCDAVLAAIHSRFNMPKNEMTKRVIKGIRNKYVNILAHPTGRLINERRAVRDRRRCLYRRGKEGQDRPRSQCLSRSAGPPGYPPSSRQGIRVKIAIDTDAHADVAG